MGGYCGTVGQVAVEYTCSTYWSAWYCILAVSLLIPANAFSEKTNCGPRRIPTTHRGHSKFLASGFSWSRFGCYTHLRCELTDARFILSPSQIIKHFLTTTVCRRKWVGISSSVFSCTTESISLTSKKAKQRKNIICDIKSVLLDV